MPVLQLPRFRALAAIFALLAFAIADERAGAQTDNSSGFHRIEVYAPHGTTPMQSAVATTNASPAYTYNGVLYNGGSIMTSPSGVNVYIIWYGNWPEGNTRSIVSGFITRLSGSHYWNILATYFDFNSHGQRERVSNKVNLKGSIVNHYSFGSALTDDDVGLLIQNAVTANQFPADPNGVYFVLASGDVDETSGLCALYCGFHGWQPVLGLDVNKGSCGDPNAGCLLGAFVGGQARCPTLCTWQAFVSGPAPNGNIVADGMVATVAHELAETETDPWGDGWVNPDYSEIADLCDGNLVTLKTLPSGQNYNLTLGDRHYLNSGKWVNALGGYCGLFWYWGN